MPTTEQPALGFEDLGLSDAVMKAVRDLRYHEPTPVQAQAIPAVLAGRDVLAAAQTGTGKTAAFLLPTLSTLGHVVRRGRDRKLARGRGPRMLIVTPTRELAQQIDEVCTKIAARTKHIAVTVVGGLSYNPQRSALARGCDVLVATPGRLVDLINQGACNLSEVEVLVLDEADRMLDMGFLPDVRAIVSKTPEERQTLLFSATLDEKAVGGITDLVRDPVRVEIAPATATADTVAQFVLPVSLEAKNALLAEVLKQEGPERVIVFTRTKHRADACCRRLARAGIKAQPIHGNRTQSQREHALEAFRRGQCDVLVATDVLSRGIDITDVRYVVNFDVPEEPTDYIHRIGRTGRAGEVGWALTFVTEQDIDEFFDIEALMGKTADLFATGSLPVGERPPAIDPDRVPAARSGKRKKKRRGGSSSRKRPAQATPAASRRADERRSAASAPAHDAQPAPADAPAARDAKRNRRASDARPRDAKRDASGKGASERDATKQGSSRAARSARARGGQRRDASAEPAPARDWRNADYEDNRRSRRTRGNRSDGRDRRAGRSGANGRADNAAARTGSSRRPGDRGGRTSR